MSLHLDTAETAAITRQFTHIAAERKRLYRPTFFRTILQIDRSVPSWVDKIESQQLKDISAQPKPLQMLGGQVPKATVERTANTTNQFQFVNGYDVMDLEVIRAEKTGLNISAARANACNTSAEQLLEQIAATGDPYGMGLVGLLNNANVTIVAAGAGGFTGNWVAAGTFASILADLQLMAKSVYVGSKQNFQADTLVLPLPQYFMVNEKTNGTTDRTVKELFLSTTDSIKRIVPWNPAATAGAGSVTRACVFDSSQPQVARMVISQELTEQTPVRIPLGSTQILTLITGGVISDAPQGMSYFDGI